MTDAYEAVYRHMLGLGDESDADQERGSIVPAERLETRRADRREAVGRRP